MLRYLQIYGIVPVTYIHKHYAASVPDNDDIQTMPDLAAMPLLSPTMRHQLLYVLRLRTETVINSPPFVRPVCSVRSAVGLGGQIVKARGAAISAGPVALATSDALGLQ